MTNKCYRHGEIAFRLIDKLPAELKQEKTKIIVQGSHGNAHSFDNGKLYFKKVDNYIFGYFVADETTLFHNDHGVGKQIKKAKLPNGIYELRRQIEWINSELKQVID